MSANKMPSNSKKTSSSNRTTAKRTTSSAKSKRKTKKKPKMYVPASKAIVLCIGVIAVCVLLLLAANILQEKKKTGIQEPPSITQRFEEQNTTDSAKSDNNKSDSHKNDNKTSANKNDSSKTNNSKSDGSKTSNSTSSGTTSNVTQSNRNQSNGTKTDAAKTDSSKSDSQTTNTQNQSTNQTTISTNNPQIASIKTDNKTDIIKPDSSKTDSRTDSKTDAQKTSKFNFPRAQNNAQLIFVFDDGGQNIQHLKKFLELPFPITVAVLPQITHSKESADMVRKSGNELMLHQPMQSVNAKINPGPGAITPDMSENQVISTLFTNINEIGPIEGMNNHEGSAITADADMMAVVMKLASEEGIFFLDSRTNVETKVPYVARELGYSWYERNIFLDNEKTRANALSELNKGLALANKNGSVIMIGHIWSADFLPAFLKEAYPELKAQGYTFSTVSKSRAKKN